MRKESVRNHQEWWERLAQAGCPLGLGEDCTIMSNEPALRITQLGHPGMENYVMEMPSGLTNFMLGIHMVCLAPKLYLEAFGLTVPGADLQILCLPDPEEIGPDKMNYVMPEHGGVYLRDQVINHRVGTELRRGQAIKGWALASSTIVLPDHIKHSSFAPVKFGVVDEYQHVHSEDFQLYVDRSRGPKMQRTTKDRIERLLIEEAGLRQPPPPLGRS